MRTVLLVQLLGTILLLVTQVGGYYLIQESWKMPWSLGFPALVVAFHVGCCAAARRAARKP